MSQQEVSITTSYELRTEQQGDKSGDPQEKRGEVKVRRRCRLHKSISVLLCGVWNETRRGPRRG